MSGILAYKSFTFVLLGLLTVSSGLGAYLYNGQTNIVNSQNSRTTDLNSQISSLNSQIEQLKAEIANLTLVTSNLTVEVNGLKTQVAILQTQVSQLQSQIQQLQATGQLQAGQIQQLQKQVAALESLVQLLQMEIQQLQIITLNGAGSTMPAPFLSAAIASYFKSHLNVTINYQAIGSGAGVAALIQKTIDFAASDAPLSVSQTSALPAPALHIPETIGSVAIAYNLPGIASSLNLNSTILAKIFQGQITSWNDIGIAQLNPSLTLPSNPIVVVHRADGSGTTFVFTSYLQQFSGAVWTLGSGTAIPWPVGLGASGNAGVAGVVQGTQFTIGYVEMSYALSNGMRTSSLLNAAGAFVQPSTKTATYAVANFTGSFPAGDQSWTSVSLLNMPGTDSYPIVSFTYVLVYRDLSILSDMTLQKATALVNFLWFLVHDAQTLGSSLSYPLLPAKVVTVDEATLRLMTFNGQSLHS